MNEILSQSNAIYDFGKNTLDFIETRNIDKIAIYKNKYAIGYHACSITASITVLKTVSITVNGNKDNSTKYL